MLHNLKRTCSASNEMKTKTRKISNRMSEIFSSPVKSFSDHKEYRLIKLSNGMTTLLIQHFIQEDPSKEENEKNISESDVSVVSSKNAVESCSEGDEEEDGDDEDDGDDDNQKEKMAAVALCVKVGSFFDPSTIQGLSHFLEHMIFMGSEKYPKENEFDQFTSTNGGENNAHTECEYTKFYFEIVEEHLASCIDRFTQLFISPLMLRDSMEREMEAVESEFQNSISNDDIRIMQLYASLANGPASVFTWGNLKTLKDGISNDELYEVIHNFRKKHYVANQMYLCVESALPLDDSQKLIEESFGAIQSGPKPEPLSIPENFFKPEFYEKVYYVKPKADKNKLYMTFLLPSMEKHYKSKPHDYLAYVLQHEGVGSLSSYLKKKLLALRVEAGIDDQSFEGNSMFSLFSIVITLTVDGIRKINVVLEAIFSFLLLLKEASTEEHEKAFMELKQIKDTSFKYREEREPTDNAEELVVNMMYYSHDDILTGPDILFRFDGALIRDMIERLNERRFNLLVLTDKHESYRKIEKWFGTEYDEVDFPESFVNLWNNRRLNPELSMPPPNEFICQNFTIIAQHTDASELPKYPKKIFENEFFECFYKLDETFKLPHACINVYLVSPKTISSTRQVVLTTLYSIISKHYMSEKLYPAVVAGLGYHLASEDKGMMLKLSGYDEKLPTLLEIITKELRNISGQMESSVFEMYRKQFKKVCYNKLIESESFNKDCRLNIIDENYKLIYNRYVETDHVTFEELKEFASAFLSQLKVHVLVQGNISKSTAMKVSDIIIKNLNCSDVDKNISLDSRARKLPSGSSIFCVKSMLPNDKNSTTANYIQIGSSTIRLQCLVEFIEKIMEEPLFDILRTQEQLGYTLYCSHRVNHGIVGISVTVQSQENKHPTTLVYDRIEKFLHENMLEILDKMNDEEFTTVQNALIKLKNMVDVELESEVNRHWSEITNKEYIFNRLELEAQMIAQLTKTDVLDFYKSKVIASDARKLSIQVIGSVNEDDQMESRTQDNFHVPQLQIPVINLVKDEVNLITDMEVFKSSLEFHPVTRTKVDLSTKTCQ